MNTVKKVVAIITTLVMLAVMVPSDMFNQPVYAADTVEVTSWEDIHALVDADGKITNKNIILKNDIRLSGNIEPIARLENSTFDGNGNIITLAVDSVITMPTGNPSATSLGLFCYVINSTIKNVMFKTLGDVHAGVDQGNYYHQFDPAYLVEVGLVAGHLNKSNVENVAIVSDSAWGTFIVRKRGTTSSGLFNSISAGLLTGKASFNSNISGLYIDMDIEGGYQQHVLHESSVGLAIGAIYMYYVDGDPESTTLRISDFMVQGQVDAFAGSGLGYVAAGGLIGRINDYFTSHVYLTDGIVTATTNAYDFQETSNTWLTHSNNGEHGAVIGEDDDYYEDILEVSNVISTYDSDTESVPNIHASVLYNLPASTPPLENLDVSNFSNNWIETVSGGIGDISLKWLVNPENENITIAEAAGGFTLTSASSEYAEKNASGNLHWTVSGEVPLKGKLDTANTLMVTREVANKYGIFETTIYNRQDPEPTTYLSGGTYYFGVEYETINFPDTKEVWSVDTASETAGVEIDVNNGTLTIPANFSKDSAKTIEISVKVQGITQTGVSSTEKKTITVPAISFDAVVNPAEAKVEGAGPSYATVAVTANNMYGNANQFEISDVTFLASDSTGGEPAIPDGALSFNSTTNNVVLGDLTGLTLPTTVTMSYTVSYGNTEIKTNNTATFIIDPTATTVFSATNTSTPFNATAFTATPSDDLKDAVIRRPDVTEYTYSFTVPASGSFTSETFVEAKVGTSDTWVRATGSSTVFVPSASGEVTIELRKIPEDNTDTFQSYAESSITPFSFDIDNLSFTVDPDDKDVSTALVTTPASNQEALTGGESSAKFSNYNLVAQNGETSATLNLQEIFRGTSHSSLAANGIAKGDIIITVANNNKYSYSSVSFSSNGYTYVSATGGGIVRPFFDFTTITNPDDPNGNSMFAVSISHADSSASIYYTTDGSSPVGNDGSITGTEYVGPVGITHLPTTIRAVAESTEGASSVASFEVTQSNIGATLQPTIVSVGGEEYTQYAAYDAGLEIALDPPEGWEGEIRYLFNASSANIATQGLLYDPLDKPTLLAQPNETTKFTTLYVAFVYNGIKSATDNNTVIPIVSNVVAYRINYNSTASNEIIANKDPDVVQFPNTVVHLSLPDSELSQINAQNVDAFNYEEAVAADEALKSLYDIEGGTVELVINDSALKDSVSRYVNYEYSSTTDETELYLPQIVFNNGQGNLAESTGVSKSYTYAKRAVENTYEATGDGNTELVKVEVTYTAPTNITITGSAGANYTILAQVRPNGAVGVNPSSTAKFLYTIAPQVENVTMSPDPKTAEPGTFTENTYITLTTPSVDTTIYYGINLLPQVEYNETTLEWDIIEGTEYLSTFRLGSSLEQTRVYTVAVSNDNTMQTRTNEFALSVSPLPQADPPDPVLPTESTVVSGDALRFTTNIVSGEIYYTLTGGKPNPDDYVQWVEEEIAKNPDHVETDPDPVPADGHVNGTYKYDDNTGIIATFNPGESVFTIVAVAFDGGGLKQYSTSEPVRVQYLIQSASTPTSIPVTAIDNIPIVVPGTSILLYSTTANAKIFYTDDGSEPQFSTVDTTDPVTGIVTTDYVPLAGTTTKLIGVDEEPVMPSGTQAFYSVRAIAVANDHVPSAEALLMFQPPAPVQPVSPSISHLQPVASNTPISFTTSTEGASIIYKVYDTITEARADAVDANGEPSLLSATNGTLYSESTPFILTEDSVIRVVAEKDNVQSVEVFYEYKVAAQLSAPTLSIPNGSIIYPGAVINITGDANGDISYTTNGDDPKAAEPADLLYGSSYVVTADYGETITVKVISSAQGYTPSETQVYSYTVCNEEDYLTTTPTNDEPIRSGDIISLSTTVTNGEIYYTTDNSSPVVGGVGGGSAVSITADGVSGGTFTVKAVVSLSGATPGNVVVSNFRMAEKTPAPTSSIPTGAITLDGATATLSASEGSIYYTTDGTDPTSSSNLYANPLAITQSMNLRIVAIADGKAPSDIVSYIYTRAGETAMPEFSKNGGSIEQNSSITLRTSTDDAQIYYTTSGSAPDPDALDKATLYNGPITISNAVTIKAIAVAEGLHPSIEATATFTVVEPELPQLNDGSDGVPTVTSSDRLASRRTYDNSEGGPTYDVVFSDTLNNVIVSVPEETIEDDVDLSIETILPSQKQKDLLIGLGYNTNLLFDVGFTKDTAVVSVDGEFEIGLPIDSEYQNGTVVIYRLNDDGSVTSFDVRRSGGIAYAIVDEPGIYTVGLPLQSQQGVGLFGWLNDLFSWLKLLI